MQVNHEKSARILNGSCRYVCIANLGPVLFNVFCYPRTLIYHYTKKGDIFYVQTGFSLTPCL